MAADSPASSGTWGTAHEVPGIAALNAGGLARISSVACASAGNCSAGGVYTDNARHMQVFVVGEVNGTWGTAKEVPGTAALNRGGSAYLISVSCASAGNCSAGGYYTDISGGAQAFVVGEVNGTWGSAKEVPGTAALNRGGSAYVGSVSCPSAANCSAGGSYSNGRPQAFVVSEVKGTWGTAKEVPGTAALNTGGSAQTGSVSCASAGNCSAGGYYTDSSGHGQAFVVGEVNSTWATAKDVPGTAALNTGGLAQINSVSCGTAGNCSAGGFYTVTSGNREPFVVGEVNGSWRTAKEVTGTAALNTGYAQTASVSCGTAGNCSAGGFYMDASGNTQAFVAGEVNGAWAPSQEVPGTAALNMSGLAQIASVSCPSAGNCSAVGSYRDGFGFDQVFVIDEDNGAWGTAQQIPGTAALNTGGSAAINSVSCAIPHNCSAGGSYRELSGVTEAFIVSET